MTDQAPDLEPIWSQAVAAIPTDELTGRHRALLRLTKPVGLMNDTAVVAAPDVYTQTMIETKLRPILAQVLSQILERKVQIAVTVDPSMRDDEHGTGQPDSGTAAPHHEGDRTTLLPPLRSEASERSTGADDDELYGGSPPAYGDHPDDHDDHDDHDAAENRQRPLHAVADTTDPADATDMSGAAGTDELTELPADAAKPTNPAAGSAVGAFDSPASGNGVPPRQALGSSSAGTDRATEPPAPTPIDRPNSAGNGAVRTPQIGTRLTAPGRLNPKYTFENFVRGPSNRLAFAAASAVAETPAKAYNPLFIYGGSGLGKTHLLHAIGNYAHQVFRDIKVLYVSSEEFTNDFINAIANIGRGGSGDQRERFRRRYRDVDILMIDDIQFLERAEQTQEEFFHTFNTLHNANKQIVITSDRTPRELTTLEDRLRSRFVGGLTPDIQTPDLETRLAILRRKAQQEGLTISPEVMELIATKIQSNIRELEGALIRVSAFANLTDQGVDMDIAQHVIKDLIPDSQTQAISAPTIMQVVANYFSVSLDDLTGRNRSKALVMPRQIAMYLCRELTDLSLPRIGQSFGGKDHTTVMHAYKKVAGEMKEKRHVYNQVAELTTLIKAEGRGE